MIGVTCIPNTETGFCVLQMSELGDLFYQPFIARATQEAHTSGAEPQRTYKLSRERKEFCKNWIKELVALEQKNQTEDHFDLDLNVLECDCSREFEELIYLKNPHNFCALCNDNGNEQFDASLDGEKCNRCGINIATGRQLLTAAQKNNILTSQTFTNKQGTFPLNIFPEEEIFQNSLSQGFRQNWLSDDPTPITHKIERETLPDNNNENNNAGAISHNNSENEVCVATVSTSETLVNVTPVKATHTTPVRSQARNVTSGHVISHDISAVTPAKIDDTMATTGSPQKSKSVTKVKRKIGLSMGF